MKYALTTIAIALASCTLMAAPTPRLGGIGDGGGQGFVCRGPTGEVLSAQLLDLQEATDYYALNIEPQPETRPYLAIAREYAMRIGSAMPSSFPTSHWASSDGRGVAASGYEVSFGVVKREADGERFADAVQRIDENKLLVQSHSKIPPLADSNPRVLPAAPNCEIEQIARYKDSNHRVHIQAPIWDKLSNVSKAALLVHEALYRRMREFGETNSDRTRTAVAYLFAGLNYEPVLSGVADKFLTCWSEDSNAIFRFVVHQDAQRRTIANFLIYNGEVMLTKTEVLVPLGLFAEAFGKAESNPGNSTVFDRLKNPMIDYPNYTFSIQTDANHKVSVYFEAVSLVGGLNRKRISCNNHLTRIIHHNDGSISIGTAGN